MEINKTNIYKAFTASAKRRGKNTAIIYLGSRFSYSKLYELSEKFGQALIRIGVTPGQKVIIYLPNSIQWVAAWLGIQRAGGVCVPITPIYTAHDLTYIANDSKAETIVCADTNFGYVKKSLSKTKIKRVIISGMAELLPWWKRYFGQLFDIIPKGKIDLNENTFSLRKFISSNNSNQPEIIRKKEDIAEILYTGGTTRFPKGVPITNGLFLQSAVEMIGVSDLLFPADENIIMGSAPLFHILGQGCGLATLFVGGALILQPKTNIDATLEAIYRFKAKSMIGVPTLYRMILEHERLDQYDLSSVEYWFSGGDVLPVEVGRRWKKRFGKTIHQGYGATETCGGVTMCPVTKKNPPKSAGRVLSHKKVKIVDPKTLKPVKPGAPGELLVSSKPMVTGYLNKPRETAESFVELEKDTWYRTADIMSMDKDGNLFFVDRTVDVIKHKGYRVSATEIEAVLQEHPAIISSCVVGLPDEKVGERIKAYVVLKEDIKGITGYELIKWCRKTLVSYKVPQYIEFRDMLPKSKVGKLLRREIRDEEGRRIEP